MADKIKLPALPELAVIDKHIPSNIVIRGYTADQLRARDQEIVRVVLLAAASIAEDQTQEYENYTGQPLNLAYQCADAIRALEFTNG